METAVSPLTVVEIPLALIDPSPDNPRHVITDAMVETLAENMKREGQKTPAKVRRKDGSRYEVLAGHIRRLAALQAGLPGLKCLVLEVTPQQAFLEAVLDNRGQPMGWLDDYLVIEKMTALFPDMKQEELAARIEVDRTTVSKAQKLVKLINQASRDLICDQITKSDPYQVTQRVMLALAGLAAGSPEDPAQVEAALRVAVERKLKEKDALKLAKWVKQGGKPEDFGQKGVKETGDDPWAAYWSTLGPGIKVKHKGGETYQVQMTVQGRETTWSAASAASRVLRGNQPASPPTSRVPSTPSPIEGEGRDEGGIKARGVKVLAQLGAVLGVGHPTNSGVHKAFSNALKGRVVTWIFQSWGSLTRFYQKRGVKNPVLANVLTILVLLTIANGLWSHFKHYLRGLLYVSPYPVASLAKPQAPGLSPQGETRAVVVPSPSNVGLGNEPGALSVPTQSNVGVGAETRAVVVPSPTYSGLGTSVVSLQAPVSSTQGASVPVSGEQPALSPIERPKGAESVTAQGPALKRDANSSSASGEDLGKKLGDGVKDLNDAVNKADTAKSATDKAKSLLGF